MMTLPIYTGPVVSYNMKKSKSKLNTVELQWLEHLWDYENLFEAGVVRALRINYRARSGGIIGISFRFSST